MPRPAPTARAVTTAWWAWVVGQACVLSLYCARFGFAGGYPQPVEATADVGVAVAEMVLAVLLAPVLLTSGRDVMRAGMPAIVFLILAGCVAGRSAQQTLEVLIAVLAWLGAFACWARRPVVRLVLTFLVVGMPVLAYAGAEYHSPPLQWSDWPWQLSPVLGICSIRLHGALFPGLMWPLAGILARLLLDLMRQSRLPLHGNQPISKWAR